MSAIVCVNKLTSIFQVRAPILFAVASLAFSNLQSYFSFRPHLSHVQVTEKVVEIWGKKETHVRSGAIIRESILQTLWLKYNRGVYLFQNLVSHACMESLETHRNLRNLIESDKYHKNLIRIHGITWKSHRESFQNLWNLYQNSESLEFRVKIINWFTPRGIPCLYTRIISHTRFG